MNREQAIQVLRAIRDTRPGAIDFTVGSFPEQVAFIEDESKLVSALCSRRAGKSYATGIKLCKACLAEPDSYCMYAALTRVAGWRTMYPILKKINRRFGLGAEFNLAELSMKFPNGSCIFVYGINNSDREQEKVLGQAYALAVIDECASMDIDLERVIKDKIQPTLIDRRGQLCCIGTPGNVLNYFYDITEGSSDAGWSRHHWNTLSNPHLREQWQEAIDKLKLDNPNIALDAGFQQHYLGRWVIDTSKLVYRYSPSLNLTAHLPYPSDEYTWILGMDTGWNDATSLVIAGWHRLDPTLQYVWSFSKSKMYMDEVIAEVNHAKLAYRITHYTIDGAAKQWVEELKRRTHIPFKPALKTDKMKTIHMMNADFVAGRIKVLQGTCDQLIGEWSTLIIDESDPMKPRENPAQENHCADAALYVWRTSKHYLSEVPGPAVDEYKRLEDAHVRSLEDRHRRRLLNNWYDPPGEPDAGEGDIYR